MLEWPIRLASVVALTFLAYGWGDWFSSERPAVDGILLGLLTMVLLFALARLYRPGGLAAFDLAEGRRAPGEVVTETAPAAVIAPRREGRLEKVARRERERRERRASAEAAVPPSAPFAQAAPPAPTPPSPPARARSRETPAPPPPVTAPLWSRERSRTAPPPTAASRELLDLNAATADELAMLPGIGRGAATRVIDHRETYGPFGSVGELSRVEGFDASRISRVAGRLRT